MYLNLNPIAFSVGPIQVRWYGIFMALSILLGMIYFFREGKKRGVDEDDLYNIVLLVVIFGVIGARLMFVLANYPGWFINDPIQVLKIYEGGLAWHGGLLGGFLAGWWYTRRKNLNLFMLADLVVPGLSIGNILVRIGNIFNGEVLGRMTAFSFGRWPAQLVGSAIGLILLIRYFYVQEKDPPNGYQFWSFLFYYQLLRGIFEETVRENPLFIVKYINETWGFGFLTLTQWVTVPLLILFYYFMVRCKKGYYD
ncbi:prolipoprotein diacylglyceryl transferase [Calorimonas adulescens]|uniref:Phosphatidylglycerol--prolipoprotein diacylglyceryl transferase n=1 Tax=Calorimonas adulescens TaxID=2606906 RepID=A0A5D8Q8S1_9THEO|nr:prolipoprotein diacylglyceryl transferase [Calorimonas adulescens]TZE80882.1 prolipoprotein diacylglyceryl transferase [Calorimonas adulescens]